MFIKPLKIIKTIFTVLISLVVLYFFWLIGINSYAWWQYNPEAVSQKFVLLIENPTEVVTQEEKKILASISESSWFDGWQQENQLKTLRKFTQNNPVTLDKIDYQGSNQNNAQILLKFDNDFENPESKEAVLFLQKQGQWYTTGYRWQIFDIQMPEEKSITQNLQDKLLDSKDNLEKGLDSFREKIPGEIDLW